MDISVVIPLYNEAESLPELYNWVARVMKANGLTYEVIFINDGSTDRSWQVIEELCQTSETIHAIKFRRNYGKSAALYCGFEQAQGDVVVTLDADLQDSPDEIPELYRMITQEGYDLVSGWKKKRYDPLSKTLPTKLFNATARCVSGIENLHDFNCGLKAYRKEVVKNIEVYGEMHRYIPYIAKNAGFNRIGEKVVHHQARKYGKTKFGGWNRFFNGYLDLITLWFLSTFGKRPMHFFGLLGSLMFVLGLFSVVVVGATKLYNMYNGMPYRLVTESPYFFLSLTAMIIGTLLFLGGFIGEMVARSSTERNKYLIEKILLIALIFLLPTACGEDEDCSLNGRPLMNCNLYTINDVGEVERDTLPWLTVTVFGSDTVLINRETDVKILSLPLRYTADSTVLVLHYDEADDALRDTVIIRQTNTPYFLSMTCGYQMKQLITGTSYTRHRLDSIYLLKPSPDIYGTENLQLFY